MFVSVKAAAPIKCMKCYGSVCIVVAGGMKTKRLEWGICDHHHIYQLLKKILSCRLKTKGSHYTNPRRLKLAAKPRALNLVKAFYPTEELHQQEQKLVSIIK